jgi:hypothetical protein
MRRVSLLFPCSVSAFSLLSPRVSISSMFRLCFVSLGYFSFFAPEMLRFVRFCFFSANFRELFFLSEFVRKSRADKL